MGRMDIQAEPEARSEQTLERAAFAGAAAIQRIIAERDDLRRLTQSQQAEIARLRSSNDVSRKRVLLIRQQYLELATEILGQFEKFDGALLEAVDEHLAQPSRSDEDSSVSTAQRPNP
ncbi:MAG: hypothetical protein E4H01_17320 [Lysobacterales bacterium]|nr:MAG: hypothetical protein E4H01_17320 [Xanthomonadales bacterium]